MLRPPSSLALTPIKQTGAEPNFRSLSPLAITVVPPLGYDYYWSSSRCLGEYGRVSLDGHLFLYLPCSPMLSIDLPLMTLLDRTRVSLFPPRLVSFSTAWIDDKTFSIHHRALLLMGPPFCLRHISTAFLFVERRQRPRREDLRLN